MSLPTSPVKVRTITTPPIRPRYGNASEFFPTLSEDILVQLADGTAEMFPAAKLEVFLPRHNAWMNLAHAFDSGDVVADEDKQTFGPYVPPAEAPQPAAHPAHANHA